MYIYYKSATQLALKDTHTNWIQSITALVACVTALVTMALHAMHNCQSCVVLKYHPSGACLLDHNDCHKVNVNKLMQFTDTSWLLMVMHIIMDNGERVVCPIQGLLILDS